MWLPYHDGVMGEEAADSRDQEIKLVNGFRNDPGIKPSNHVHAVGNVHLMCGRAGG